MTSRALTKVACGRAFFNKLILRGKKIARVSPRRMAQFDADPSPLHAVLLQKMNGQVAQIHPRQRGIRVYIRQPRLMLHAFMVDQHGNQTHETIVCYITALRQGMKAPAA